MNYFKLINGSNILNSIIFIILGLIFVFAPTFILGTLNLILCSLFILIGISQIISHFSFNSSLFKYSNLITGIICITLGILCLNAGQIFETLLRILIAVWMIVSSIKRLNLSIILFKNNIKGHGLLVLFSAIFMLICGIYIIFTPNVLLITLGIVILIYSILDLVDSILFMVNFNKIFD